MHEIYTLNNPFSIVFKDTNTNTDYQIIFDDTTGILSFKTDDAMYTTKEFSYFNNSAVLSTLRDVHYLNESVVITTEYLLFLSKLKSLFEYSGDKGRFFFNDLMYIENQCRSNAMISAYCKLYAYNHDEVSNLLSKSLHFVEVDVHYVHWLFEQKTVLKTPLNFTLELGDGYYNISTTEHIITRILSANKPVKTAINVFDELLNTLNTSIEEDYRLVKTLFTQLVPMSLASYLATSIHDIKVLEDKRKILINQLDRCTELMCKFKFKD